MHKFGKCEKEIKLAGQLANNSTASHGYDYARWAKICYAGLDTAHEQCMIEMYLQIVQTPKIVQNIHATLRMNQPHEMYI